MIYAYLLAPSIGWAVAHAIKFLLANQGKGKFASLYQSGGMPSGHTSMIISLLTVIGFRDGIGSSVFAVCAALAAIVMYDAVMVRRTVGEQGLFLENIFKQLKTKDGLVVPRIARGHTVIEVAAGAVLGAILGTIVFFATK